MSFFPTTHTRVCDCGSYNAVLLNTSQEVNNGKWSTKKPLQAQHSALVLTPVGPDPPPRGLLHGSPEHREDPAAERSLAQRLQRGGFSVSSWPRTAAACTSGDVCIDSFVPQESGDPPAHGVPGGTLRGGRVLAAERSPCGRQGQGSRFTFSRSLPLESKVTISPAQCCHTHSLRVHQSFLKLSAGFGCVRCCRLKCWKSNLANKCFDLVISNQSQLSV